MIKTKLFCLFPALVFFLSCEDDAPRMLTLHTPQQVDNSIVLTWAQPDISGFQYYMVMRASDGKNYNIINDITTPTSTAFRKEITSFTDYTYPLEVDTLYYKIIAVGNEPASSENVLFRNKNKVLLLTGNYIDMYYIEEENKISVVTSSNVSPYNSLKVFDLQSGQFLPDEAGVYLSSSCSWIMWGHYNGKTEVYHYPSNNTIVCYDAATARQITTIAIPDMCYDPYTTNHKGMIYFYGYYLYLVNRATGNYTQYQPTHQLSWPDHLYYNPKNNKLYALRNYSNNNIMILNLNEDGNILNDEIFQIVDDNSTPVFVENSSLFIVTVGGQVKILDMNTQTYHTTDLTDLPFLYGLKAVLVNNSIYLSAGTNKIYKISTVDYQTSDIFTIRVIPRKLLAADGYLYYIGQYGNNFLLDKISL
jgi:hypothetical protein